MRLPKIQRPFITINFMAILKKQPILPPRSLGDIERSQTQHHPVAVTLDIGSLGLVSLLLSFILTVYKKAGRCSPAVCVATKPGPLG